MRLYHFSNKDFSILKPDFFGENVFTKNDAIFNCKRFFCYETSAPAEKCFLFSNFRYVIRIKDKFIYNLDNDVLGLKQKFNYDIDKILSFCAKKYHAIQYNTSFKTFCIFRQYRIFTKEKLIAGIPWN
jgi:hypothetical protein